MKDLVPILGKPTAKNTYKEEAEKYKHQERYAASREMLTGIPFDSLYTFDNHNSYGVWRVYARHDSVIVIDLGRFTHSKATIASISSINDLRFYDDSATILKKLGIDYIDGFGTKEYKIFCYPKKGITVFTNENELCSILLYKGNDMNTPVKKPDPCDAEGSLLVFL